MSSWKDRNQFDDLPVFRRRAARTTGPDNEIKRYINSPTVVTKDPIQWWWDHRREYPRLSRMALNYLTIPGTSSMLLVCSCY